MRRRVLVTYLSLLAAVIGGLAVPFAANLARDATRSAYIDRQSDTARFASLAEPALRTGDITALQAELQQHERLYGIATAVVDRDEEVVLASRPELAVVGDPLLGPRVSAALSGSRPGAEDVIWPWTSGPLVVTEPVTSNGIVIGVVVTVSPTRDLRGHILTLWGLLAAAGLLALAAGLAPAARITGWILRPVRQLDEVTHEIADGRLDARVATDSGPAELRRLGESFNTMADATAALLEQQRAFASHASHQLRTPLATLRLRVEDLSAYLRPDGLAEHQLTLGEVDRLNAVCHGLLALARAESGRLPQVHVDAAAVADERVAAWRPVASASGVTLRREGCASAIATAMLGAVDQALDALIDNAVKFAGPGRTVRVEVSDGGDGPISLVVVDDGPGLPEPDLALAVRPFWRAPAVQNVDGSGLGLPIVASLIRASNGTVEVGPNRPRGLRVQLRLPSARHPADPEPAPLRSAAAAGPPR
jgi:signal transduction histidine kinase